METPEPSSSISPTDKVPAGTITLEASSFFTPDRFPIRVLLNIMKRSAQEPPAKSSKWQNGSKFIVIPTMERLDCLCYLDKFSDSLLDSSVSWAESTWRPPENL
jgi:hypothetical protein